MFRDTKSRIAIFKRHFNILGEDIVANLDTAVIGLFGGGKSSFITLSVTKDIWDKLALVPAVTKVKHPGIGVECIKLLGDMYIRKQARTDDDNLIWSANIGCMVPRTKAFYASLEALVVSRSTSKKTLAYIDVIIKQVMDHAKLQGVKLV